MTFLKDSDYKGRFAPSPTGPLHLGSLIAALASYLDARAHGGDWLLRMEDLDPPREEPGAADSILASLRAHGLHWDGDVLYQSPRAAAYDQALAQLDRQQLLFRCDCTRAMLGPGGACHGRCLPRQREVETPHSLRVKVAGDCHIHFQDGIQGEQAEALGQSLPDFVVHRKDGLYAYQLAVVVDDAYQGITHIVRGCDLLDSTPRQIYLQQLLGLPQPHYSHLPLITNELGQKFSKQNQAPAVRAADAPGNLRKALAFLQQPAPPATLDDCPAILRYATGCWSVATVPATREIPATALGAW